MDWILMGFIRTPFGPARVWITVRGETALSLGPPSSAGLQCWGNARQPSWWPEQRSSAVHTTGCWSSSLCCVCPELSLALWACPQWTQVCEHSKWQICCGPRRSGGAEKHWRNWKRHRWRLGGSWSESRIGQRRIKAGGCHGRWRCCLQSGEREAASTLRCRSLLALWSLAPDVETD